MVHRYGSSHLGGDTHSVPTPNDLVGLVAQKNVLRMGDSRAVQVLRMAPRPSQGNGVRKMENLTSLENLFLQLLAKLDEQQRQDVLRIMEALVESSK